MIYVVHDEEGRVMHSTKVYDGADKYPAALEAHGQNSYVRRQGSAPPNASEVFVNTKTKRVNALQTMKLKVVNRTFKAGGKEACEITGLPLFARVTVKIAGYICEQDTLVNEGGFGFTAPVPCTCEVLIRAFPYRDAVIVATAV